MKERDLATTDSNHLVLRRVRDLRAAPHDDDGSDVGKSHTAQPRHGPPGDTRDLPNRRPPAQQRCPALVHDQWRRRIRDR